MAEKVPQHEVDALSAEQMTTLKDWLDKKTKHMKCPICDNQTWNIGAHFLNGAVYDARLRKPGVGSYPQAFVACTNCYHVRTFLAAPIGLFPEDEEGEKQDV